MIDLETIKREINELEARGDTTYSICERLSWLYTVRDHLIPESKDTQRTQHLSGSEFLELSSDLPYPSMMRVIDEHMSALMVVQPKEYELVVGRLRSLKNL